MHHAEVHGHWVTSSWSEGAGGVSDAIFPYWSFTKTVIAICALKLVEAQVLDLDAPVGDERYSLRHLLAHTSGLRDYGQFRQYHAAVANGDAPWPRNRLLDLVMADGPLFAPGDGWSYSNVGYVLVRDLIEHATGQPIGAVISDRVTVPLDLSSVELAETSAQFGRIHWPAARRYDPGWVYHGCLTGTAADASHLLHALFAGKLLQPGTLAEMTERRPLGGPVAGRPWSECGYALGLMSGRMGKAGSAIGHSGVGPFSVNAVYHFPEAAGPVTVACFTDGTDEGVAESGPRSWFAANDRFVRFAAVEMHRDRSAGGQTSRFPGRRRQGHGPGGKSPDEAGKSGVNAGVRIGKSARCWSE